jgi:hypothetical protein
MEVSGQLHTPGGRAPGTQWIGDWVGLETDLYAVLNKFPFYGTGMFIGVVT